ncbi:MAG: DUF1971 domain-containing protein [Stellaceae bacterium]
MAIPALPRDAEAYRRTDIFTEKTVPAPLLSQHRTKDGAWAMIHVLEGKLAYRVIDPRRARLDYLLTPKTLPAVIEPTILHEVEPCGAVRFFIEFYRVRKAS